MPDLERLYLVVVQIEGAIQDPIPFHLFESARDKADRIAKESDRTEDDVRVFELDLGSLKVSEVHVPEIMSSDEMEGGR